MLIKIFLNQSLIIIKLIMKFIIILIYLNIYYNTNSNNIVKQIKILTKQFNNLNLFISNNGMSDVERRLNKMNKKYKRKTPLVISVMHSKMEFGHPLALDKCQGHNLKEYIHNQQKEKYNNIFNRFKQLKQRMENMKEDIISELEKIENHIL